MLTTYAFVGHLMWILAQLGQEIMHSNRPVKETLLQLCSKALQQLVSGAAKFAPHSAA